MLARDLYWEANWEVNWEGHTNREDAGSRKSGRLGSRRSYWEVNWKGVSLRLNLPVFPRTTFLL
jgi:hypothetical protein